MDLGGDFNGKKSGCRSNDSCPNGSELALVARKQHHHDPDIRQKMADAQDWDIPRFCASAVEAAELSDQGKLPNCNL